MGSLNYVADFPLMGKRDRDRESTFPICVTYSVASVVRVVKRRASSEKRVQMRFVNAVGCARSWMNLN